MPTALNTEDGEQRTLRSVRSACSVDNLTEFLKMCGEILESSFSIKSDVLQDTMLTRVPTNPTLAGSSIRVLFGFAWLLCDCRVLEITAKIKLA